MIKNIVKTSIQTVDEITMANVKEKVTNIEKVTSPKEIEANPLSLAQANPQAEVISQKKEEEKEKALHLDYREFKKCTSKKGYKEYRRKASQPNLPLKNLRLLCEDAKLR